MKAILVIDMPKNCGECKFLSATHCGKEMCVATPIKMEWIENDTVKPDWCPLKPMPRKEITLERKINGITMNYLELAEAKGRNMVINEILGETE